MLINGQTLLRDLLQPTPAHRYLARDHGAEKGLPGLQFHLSEDFATYSALTRPNPANSPYRIMPPFLPDWRDPSGKEPPGFWIEARMGDDPVFAIAARFSEGCVRQHMARWPGDWQINPDIHLEGKLLLNGGQWIAPAYRGHEMSEVACKLLHAYAMAECGQEFHYAWAVVVPSMWRGKKGATSTPLSWRQGFRHHEKKVRWAGYYKRVQNLYFIWADWREIEASLGE